jgi:signal peptidase I
MGNGQWVFTYHPLPIAYYLIHMAEIKILEESVEDAPPPKWLSRGIEGAILAAALFLVLFLRLNVWELVVVTSNSMQPALTRGDRVLVYHRAALKNHWRRADIVISPAPPAWGDATEVLIKRIIGLPGETVQVYGGQVFINQRPLQESYIKEPMLRRENFRPIRLGPHEYFLMGDNRNNSEDSRDHGPVESRFLHGRALRLLWPLSRAGVLSGK